MLLQQEKSVETGYTGCTGCTGCTGSHVTSAGEECGVWIYWMYWMYWMYWIYSSHYNWPEKLRHPVTPWFSAEELILWVSTLLYPDIPKNSIRNAKGPGVFTGKKKTFPTMFANILTFPQ